MEPLQASPFGTQHAAGAKSPQAMSREVSEEATVPLGHGKPPSTCCTQVPAAAAQAFPLVVLPDVVVPAVEPLEPVMQVAAQVSTQHRPLQHGTEGSSQPTPLATHWVGRQVTVSKSQE
jgi:hypothetical protein